MRYLPLTDQDRQQMLSAIGVDSIDDLYCDVPKAAQRDGLVDLPKHQGELDVERHMTGLATKNLSPGCAPSFIGGGAYRHHVPASVDYLIQRGEFLTAYTPYQPEIAQGTLQYLFEFQSQVATLTGMDVANASLYDGSTGTTEAVIMANRITRKSRALLSSNLHPHYVDIVKTHAEYLGFEVAIGDPDPTKGENLIDQITPETSCVVVQTPDIFGNLHDLRPLAKVCQENKVLLIAVVTEVMSLGLVESPGAMGADIVVCEGQSIGNGLSFGGPYVGLFATRDKYTRQMPGRLCGETVDADGTRGYVLTLSTREQHIRREKATSNICTNAGLCSLAFTIHLSILGGTGLKRLAKLNHARACQLADRLAGISGVEIINDSFFNEFSIRLPKPAAGVVEALADDRILGGIPASRLYPGQADLENILVLAATETNSEADIDALASRLEGLL